MPLIQLCLACRWLFNQVQIGKEAAANEPPAKILCERIGASRIDAICVDSQPSGAIVTSCIEPVAARCGRERKEQRNDLALSENRLPGPETQRELDVGNARYSVTWILIGGETH